ncbi:MAG: hypothetical protein HRT87_02245, partial [Legionellales bacterium]|nr:hypothetical protein [Legionellales bacterium]
FYLIVIELSKDDTFKILHEYSDKFYDNSDLKKKISSYVLRHDLSQAKCNWILNPEEYKLLVFDIPPIPEEEQLQALKWEVLEKTDSEEEEVLLDFMDIPANSKSDKSSKTFSVIVNKKQMIERASILESSRLNLCTIDITENALTNLFRGTKFDNKNVALIVKVFGKLTLLICKNNRLFLTRKLSLTWGDDSSSETAKSEYKVTRKKNISETSNSKLTIANENEEPIHQLNITKSAVKDLNDLDLERESETKSDSASPEVIDLLADEIKRSFEYCTNSLNIDEPEQVLYSQVVEINKVEQKFSELINKNVEEFNISDSLENWVETDDTNMVALGGALRYQNEEQAD